MTREHPFYLYGEPISREAADKLPPKIVAVTTNGVFFKVECGIRGTISKALRRKPTVPGIVLLKKIYPDERGGVNHVTIVTPQEIDESSFTRRKERKKESDEALRRTIDRN